MSFLLASTLLAGAAKEPVTPQDWQTTPAYLAGFGNGRKATGIHDDLWARCLALSDGRRTPMVICAVDSIGLFHDDVLAIRLRVRELMASPAELIVASTHVHEAPDTMGLWGEKPGVSGINEAYNRYIVEQTAKAAVAALKSRGPAAFALAQDPGAGLEHLFDDDRPPNLNDRALIALKVTRPDGAPVATLVNWASHPESLGSQNTQITSDYVHYLREEVEGAGNGMVVFVNGAVGGMQSPLGVKVTDPQTGKLAPERTFRFAEIVGRTAGARVNGALKKSENVELVWAGYVEKMVDIPMQNPGFETAAAANLYKGRKPIRPDNRVVTPVGLLRLAGARGPLLEAAMIPGEMYPELSIGGIVRYSGADYPDAPLEPPIKGMLKAPYKMLFGLANDEIGYIIPKVEWDTKPPYLNGAKKAWYGEVNSVGPEAAARIAEGIQELLARLP